ncbi:MAG: DUF4129 domain-containing transglutaminase family protein [Gammaproteobacteria bacterium]|nr:DUF4129 domain-containing transglutaminase family protein [Gammaproteobacteria bacterium]
MPARVVTGYQGGELNALGEYYIIRQSDAHAWTEVWLPDTGWTRVDPTAAVAPERIALGSTRSAIGQRSGGVAAFAGSAFVRQAMLAWDAVNTYWNAWVIGYGPRLQRTLLEWLGLDRPRWGELLLLTGVATALLMFGLSVYLGFRLRESHSRDPAARHFARFRRRLAQLDVEPPRPGETPSAYAARAQAKLPTAADTIAEVTTTYLAARYEPDTGGAALARLESLIRDFKRSYALSSQSA